MSLTCPNCNKILITQQLHDTEIDYCENGCKGIWFDKGEIYKLKHDKQLHKLLHKYEEKTQKDIDNESIRICPKCNIPLNKINKPQNTNIYIDKCETCGGFWLDKGELDVICEYFAKHYRYNKETKTFFFVDTGEEILFSDKNELLAESVNVTSIIVTEPNSIFADMAPSIIEGTVAGAEAAGEGIVTVLSIVVNMLGN